MHFSKRVFVQSPKKDIFPYVKKKKKKKKNSPTKKSKN